MKEGSESEARLKCRDDICRRTGVFMGSTDSRKCGCRSDAKDVGRSMHRAEDLKCRDDICRRMGVFSDRWSAE